MEGLYYERAARTAKGIETAREAGSFNVPDSVADRLAWLTPLALADEGNASPGWNRRHNDRIFVTWAAMPSSHGADSLGNL